MDTLFDILTGIGLAAAAGIRPFLPGLVAGALAAANFTIDFEKTDLSFVEKAPFLLAVVIVLIVVVVLQRRGESSLIDNLLAVLAVAVGALLCAAAIADHSDTWWYGIPIGIVVAGLSFTATRNLFARAGTRLDDEARQALPLYADGASLIVAVLAIVAPPLSVVALGFLLWLLAGGRRREGEKYAGLRILR